MPADFIMKQVSALEILVDGANSGDNIVCWVERSLPLGGEFRSRDEHPSLPCTSMLSITRYFLKQEAVDTLG